MPRFKHAALWRYQRQNQPLDNVHKAKSPRLASAGLLEDTLGPDVWKTLGVPRQNVSRWRKEIKTYAQVVVDKGESHLIENAGHSLVDLMAKQAANDPS